MTDRQRLLPTRKGQTHKLTLGKVSIYLTVNVDQDGRPRELFIKADNGWQGWADVLAETASLYLQRGGEMDELMRHWRGARFEPMGVIGEGSSIPDAIARKMGGGA